MRLTIEHDNIDPLLISTERERSLSELQRYATISPSVGERKIMNRFVKAGSGFIGRRDVRGFFSHNR